MLPSTSKLYFEQTVVVLVEVKTRYSLTRIQSQQNVFIGPLYVQFNTICMQQNQMTKKNFYDLE